MRQPILHVFVRVRHERNVQVSKLNVGDFMAVSFLFFLSCHFNYEKER